MTFTALRPLVLAAGRGQRLRPLTDQLPKPLLPVLGRPLAGHSLQRLQALGCDRCALNLHHLGDAVQATFGEHYAGDHCTGLDLTYSREPELLGTLGALGPLREYFQDADLALVINGDSLCPWPLDALVRAHARGGASATLLVSTSAEPANFAGGVGLDEEDRVVSFRRGDGDESRVVRRAVFAGAHVLSAEALERGLDVAAGGVSDFVQQLYKPLLAEGATLRAVATPLSWYDLGTPRRYLDGVLGHLRDHAEAFQREGALDGNGNWTCGDVMDVATSARVMGSVVEAGVEVGARTSVEGSLLLPGCRVGADCQLRAVIVGPGVEVPAGTVLDHCLITSAAAGCRAREEDGRDGDLILTPMA